MAIGHGELKPRRDGVKVVVLRPLIDLVSLYSRKGYSPTHLFTNALQYANILKADVFVIVPI